jgi:hypothetical protein
MNQVEIFNLFVIFPAVARALKILDFVKLPACLDRSELRKLQFTAKSVAY